MAAIQKKNFARPDEERPIGAGVAQLARVGTLTVGRATFEPGWRYSTDVGPVVGSPSCPVHHFQLVLSGRLRVQMDDGETADLVAGDVADVPPGHDAWVIGDEPCVLIDVFGNVAQAINAPDRERMVTTLLMTDIVDSTATAARLGDSAWRQVLTDHNRVVRTHLDRFRGKEINTTGDGFLATFPSALSAVRCAAAVRDTVRELGIEVRVGVHTGEVEVLPNDIGGIAVHAAARIMGLGGASEVIVSAVTRGLVGGSGLRFDARGTHELRGLDDPIEVYVLAS